MEKYIPSLRLLVANSTADLVQGNRLATIDGFMNLLLTIYR